MGGFRLTGADPSGLERHPGLHAGIAASFTRGRHEVIDGATHNFMHIERPDAIRDALRNLIATT